MPQIELNEEKHEYRVNGRPAPSVTRILKSAGFIDDRFLTQEGARRGSYAHRALEFYDLGDLDETSLDPALAPYLEAWKKFRADVSFEVLTVEERVYNEAYFYAGTLDRRIQLMSGQAVVDIKTGTPDDWHPLQTALYAMCFTEPLRRYAVYLSDRGTYDLKEHDQRTDYTVAKACITIHSFKKGKGR